MSIPTTKPISVVTYNGTSIPLARISDITVEQLTVDHAGTITAPTGIAYSPVVVPQGTEGTPTATKGAVSNHQVSITPSVTNTTGYITGDTKTGAAVIVQASELVSGSETKTENGTYDVTNLETLIVNVSDELPPVNEWSGTTFTTDKNYVVSSNYNLPTGYTLNISIGKVLVIKNGSAFISNGTINNSGHIILLGQFDTLGSLTNSGEIYALIDSIFNEDGLFYGNKVESVGSDIWMQPTLYNKWKIGGNIEPYKTVTLGSAPPSTVQPGAGYDSIGEVRFSLGTVIKSENIAQGATILGVLGSYSGNIKLQEQIATPTESSQTITADDDYDGLSKVDISAIPSNYVGSAISRRTASDLTASGATVTVPQGYYASQASKSVANGSVTVNTPTIDTSTGVITASANVSAGYVSGNPQSKTLNLTTQGSTTITPTKQQQTAVASGRYTTGAVYVGAIPNEYIIPTGSKEITANADNIDVAQYSTVNVNVPSSGGNYQIKTLTLGASAPPSQVLPDSGGTQTIVPVRITDDSHQYVTIYVDIAANGTLTPSGVGKNGGQFYNPEIEPSVADFSGDETVTVYWGGGASQYRSDSKRIHLIYTIEGGQTYDALEKVNVSIDTSVIKPANIAQGVTILGVTGTHEGGGGGEEYTIYSGTEAPSGAQEGDIWIDTSGDTPAAGSTIYVNASMKNVRTASLSATGLSVTVEKAGKYKVSWMGARSNSGGTSGSRMYVNGSTVSGYNETTTFTNTYAQQITHTNVSLNAGDTVEIWARARSTSYYMMVGNLIVERTGD